MITQNSDTDLASSLFVEYCTKYSKQLFFETDAAFCIQMDQPLLNHFFSTSFSHYKHMQWMELFFVDDIKTQLLSLSSNSNFFESTVLLQNHFEAYTLRMIKQTSSNKCLFHLYPQQATNHLQSQTTSHSPSEEFSALAENISHPLFQIDKYGNTYYSNQKTGQSWKQLLSLKELPIIWKLVKQGLTFASETENYLIKGIPLSSSNQMLLLFFQRESSQKLIEQVEIISHELKNPLQSLLSNVEVLKHILQDAQQKSMLSSWHDMLDIADIMEELCHHQLHVTREWLQWSREQQKQKPQKSDLQAEKKEQNQEFHLQQLLQSVFQLFHSSSIQKSIHYTLQQPVSQLQLRGNVPQLKQILLNLLSNAFKFTPSHGSITIEAQLLASSSEHEVLLQIAVHDTGIGMDEQEVSKIFKKFQQANDQIAIKYGGNGLGLVISQNLALSMGGHIQVQSSKGKGSTFTLQVPLQLSRTKSKSILIVEDNASNRKVLRYMLEQEKYYVEEACNGEEALQKVKELYSTLECIIMDMEMPVLNGCEAATQIREWELQQHATTSVIPILCISGHSREKLYQNEKNQQLFSEMLEKPYKKSQLMECLAKVTSR